MLRKLLKYDFRESCRLLLPILGAILLISLFGRLMLTTDLFTSLPDFMQILAAIAYVLLIIICCVGAPIYFIVYFYRDFFTEKGYIIHTLPVTTNQKLLSKIITSYLLELLTFAVCTLSVIIILYDRETFALLSRGLQSVNTQFKGMTGISFYSFFFATMVMLLISMLSQLLTLFAAISIGQLFETHRILGAIAGYMFISFTNQILSTILLAAVGIGSIDSNTLMMSGKSLYALYGLSGCLSLLLSLGCYAVSYYLMEKRLNLN